MTNLIAEALACWGMEGAVCAFVAGRENRVFRLTGDRGDFALRIRRPGLRGLAELQSELLWLKAMDRAGLSVPRPERSASGAFLETVAGHHVDIAGWLTGRPLGKSCAPLDLEDPESTFFKLGREMARLHSASDDFDPPEGFTRARWDIDGLVGEEPLWGGFWDSPALDEETRTLLTAFRARARREFEAAVGQLDTGLIHADLVRENVLIDGDCLRLIDFDDGGYGFRIFDLATALLKNRHEPTYPELKSNLIEGYRTVRPMDATHLDLFMALRAVTYVGWIVPRMNEHGAAARQTRFVADARALCAAYMDREPAA